jgi:hypothetical protein
VPERRPFWEQIMLVREGDPRAGREEKVLRYIVHRLNEEAHLSYHNETGLCSSHQGIYERGNLDKED